MQTEHTPLLSIIVPIYNVEEYLPECLNSIFAQTFTDYELILVDDGSPDNCPKMCDEAAAKDARVRVIHQKNGGLSAARNAGLDIARGEWIGFMIRTTMLRRSSTTSCWSQRKRRRRTWRFAAFKR